MGMEDKHVGKISKSECRNPKQIQDANLKTTKYTKQTKEKDRNMFGRKTKYIILPNLCPKVIFLSNIFLSYSRVFSFSCVSCISWFLSQDFFCTGTT